MTALVTGGTGFVGAHVVRALLARGGDRVRCLARRGGDRSNLEGCDVEIVEGDLRDAPSLRTACAGCVEVYHCAADYRLFVRRPRDIYASNVDGTRHLLAAEHGRVGEKYILGHRNVTLVEMLRMLADITGLQAPRLRLPHWLPVGAAAVATAWARLAGGEPRVPLDSARMARYRMFFDAGKAVRELGLVQSPIREALERAVRWFEGNGYVQGPRR